MIRFFLPILLLLIFNSHLFAQQVQLTFKVDMRGQTVSSNGVHVAGNFQNLAGYGSNWNPGTTQLTDPDGDKIYEVTVSLPTGGLFQYKFVNGNSWAGAELVPAECGVNDGSGNINRTVNAISSTTTTPANGFGSCEGGTPEPPTTDYATHWWNDAVFYQIFVRSFYDSNGDGQGDFKGMMQKLDYLNDGDPATTTDLGITGIWLMPMKESPSYHGYDVTNYYATEPDYGSMADFEAFLAAAHARGIKVIIDFVMNHSSDQHPWFIESASNLTNPKRNWYRWSDTHPGYNGPWGQNVWHLRNGKYYYGLFWGGMPDLNWENAELKASMWDITRFWLNKGVDGYRIDAVKYLDETGSQLENTEENFRILEEFNQVVKMANPNAVTVGEAWSSTPSVVPYVQNDRLDLAFEFDLSSAIINSVRNNNPSALNNQLNLVNRLYPKLQYATFLTNHDQNRVMGELYGNMEHMKQAAALYLAMPGVPFLYYGEEVGMLGSGADEDKRKPMQWNPEVKAGFTTGTPWRSVNSNSTQYNVQVMSADPASLLSHYKKLITLRNAQPALRKGYHLEVSAGNASVLSFARVFEKEAVLVVSNFGADALSSPSFSVAVSSLPAGNYAVTELYTNQPMGTVTINEQGGFSHHSFAGASLGSDHTWILKLSSATTTGINPEANALEVNVYPNPAAGMVTVSGEALGKKKNSLKVYDLTGKVLYTAEFTDSSFLLDTSDLANGTYFIQVQNHGKQFMKRLVVNH
ncbi:alpha-amylase family glycosyl hydrolase [Rufibacter roseus]|uniref:Alpha-amylase n=1 Tax=Rufibacter roseus TaxID=1567108 RepID=A0ABW2DP00_9BACT|nr:alpha-amylase family glycosyl hydrolase [Rufibacter roseus]